MNSTNYLKTVPLEVYKDILLNLSPKDLIHSCQTNVYSEDICMNQNEYFWNQYINKWYKYRHPNDYGYSKWTEVANNLPELLKLFNKYNFGQRTSINVIVTDFDIPFEINDTDIEYLDDNNLYEIKTKVFNDDTVGDLFNRMLRLYDISHYKNNSIEYIKILCYEGGILEYNIQTNKILLRGDEISEISVDDKISDLSFMKNWNNEGFFRNLFTFNRVYIKIKNI